MVNNDKVFQKLIDQGYEFKFNQYIKDGYDIFKREMGNFICFYFVIFSVFFVISLVLEKTSGLVTNLVQPALTAGALLVANDILLNKKPAFSRFFDGFKFFLPLFLLGLVSSVLIVIGLLFLIVPGIYLGVSYSFANMFVVFFGYDFWTSMELSRKIITKKWWEFFGFFLTITLINIGGILACGVGIVFTAPMTLCMTYCAFEDIVGGAIREHTNLEQKQTHTTDV
ncbi:MAG: hypothetical protein C0596_02385 [Marinilabiliales bacterium]|nr:MAG: hypothetical protein C0596_02385 [Marinilabiliales bacterium]